MVTRREKNKKKFKVASAKRRAEKSGGYESTTVTRPEDMQFFRLEKAGKKTLTIIPFLCSADRKYADEGEIYFEHTFFTHRNVGAQNKMYLCPALNFNKKCPICQYRQEVIRKEGVKSGLAKKLRPSERQLFYVVDNDDQDKGVQLWDIANFFFGQELDKAMKSQDEEWTPFYDPENPSDLKCQIESNSYSGVTSYKVSRVDFIEAGEALDSKMIEALTDPAELMIEIPSKKLEALFYETSDDEEPKKKGKKVVDDDDSDDEEEESDEESDEDEEEESPKKKRKKSDDPTADDKGIKVGSRVEHEEFGECEVFNISPDGTSLTIIDEDDEKHRAVAPSEVEIIKGKKTKKKVEEDEDETDKEGDDDEPDEDNSESDEGADEDESSDSDDEDDDSEDEDSDDDSEEDDDEEEEKPKTKKKSRR
jgi:hypothetical protein